VVDDANVVLNKSGLGFMLQYDPS